MKHFQPVLKLSILLTGLMVFFITSIANATTYYSFGNNAPNTLAKWWTNTNGTGSNPSNFTTATDIFVVQSGNTYTTSAGWTVAGNVQVSGTLSFAGNYASTLGNIIVNSGGSMVVTTNLAVIVNTLTVSAGGTLTQNQNYAPATYLQVKGDLIILGSYLYTGFTPAIFMWNAGGNNNINTGSALLCKLMLRAGNYFATGNVSVNSDFYAMNDFAGSFHTNGQTVVANWGLVNSGGTLYIDGGSLTINGTTQMLIGRTSTFNGDVQMSAGTLTATGIYLGNAGATTPVGTFTQSGGTINTGILDIGGKSSFTHSTGTNNVNGPLMLQNTTSTYTQTTGSSIVNIAADLNNNGVYTTGTGAAAINIAGNWNNNLTFTTSSTNTVTFNGTGSQTIGGSVSSKFNNLTINNTAGVDISNDQTVNSTLTLTSGNLTIGSNNVILGSGAAAVAGAPFSATKMIVADGSGEVRKNFTGNGSYLFPIGDNTGTAEYSPITLNFTGGTYGAGAYAGVKVTNAKHPNNTSTTDFLKRYWTVSNSGITSPSFTVTATYLPTDLNGTVGNIAAAKYTGVLPWVKYGVLASNTLTATAATNTGSGIIFSGISNFVPSVSVSGGGAICAGGSASLGSTVTNNGTSSATYLWSPATGLSSATIANPTASPAATTAYTLTVTDGNGITGVANTTITVNSLPATPTASVTAQPTCATATGTITITAPTGLNYSIDGISYTNTTGIFTGVNPGTYNVTVKNGSGCISSPTSVTVNAQPATPAAPTASVTAQPTCAVSTGTITVTAPTGMNYSIDGISYTNTTGIFTGVNPGTYNVTVKNGSGCISSPTSVTVNAQPATPAAPGISAGGPTTFCAGGSVTLTSSAGSTYLWSNGATSASISVSASGNYSVKVTNASGCQSASSVATAVVVNALPATPTASVTAQPTCAVSTGTITITAPTGMNYSIDGITYTNTTGVFTGVNPGTYNVTVKNGSGCISSPTSITVNAQPATPAAPTASVTAQPTCAVSTGTITITAPTGMNYSIDGVTYTNTTGVFTGVNPGTYNVTVKNGSGCISSPTSITVNAQPATPAAPGISAGGPTTFCAGGSVTLTSSAGSTYLWSNGATTASITVNASGNYSVKVTNASGCQSASSVATAVVVNALPTTPTASVTAQPTCTVSTGTITVTAPTGMNYSIDGITYTNTTGVFTGVNPGTYNVTVKNGSGCISSSTSVTVNAQPATPAAPTASVTAQPTCAVSTGTITITAPTGMNYSIDGVSYTNTTGIFTGVNPGTYNVTVKNGSGCISSPTSVTVNAQPATPAAPTASVTAQPTCAVSTGTITITAPTGMNYSIDGVTYTNTTGVFTGVNPGTYNVTVKNGSGCISSPTSITVNAQPATPAAPGISAGGPTTFCAGGSVTLTSSAGSTYLWSNGATTASITVNASGNYSVKVTNASGCQSTSSVATAVVVNALPATPTASVTAQPTCAVSTGTITITAPTGMNYSIDGVTYTNTTGVFTGVNPGTYNVTVKNGSGCISSPTSVTVNAQPATPAAPGISAGGPTTFCAGGSVTLTSSAGSTYLWSNGATTASITVNASGNYSVKVTNASGCQSASSVATAVVVNALPATPTASVTAQPTCAVSTGTITITAPTGMNYSIDGVTYTNTTGVFTGVNPGTYNVTVKNGSGCISSPTSVTVNAQPATPAAPGISAGGPTTFCAGGSVTLTSSAGSTYLWSNGATSASISVSASGNYSVKVTNASGCQSASSVATAVVVNALPATPTAYVTAQPTCTVSTGTITVTAPTGMNYSIDGISYTNTTGVFTGVNPGTYNVTVKNGSGCISSPTSVIVNAQPATPAAPTASVTAQPTCAVSTGTITITAPTGMNYSIDGVSYTNTTGVFTGVNPGTYNVTVKNGSGCISSPTSITVNAQPLIPGVPSCSVTNQPTCTAGGIITILPLVAGVTYSIDGVTYGNTTGIFNNLPPGNYNVTAMNSSGCVSGNRPLTVNPYPSQSAVISYLGNPYCTSGVSVTVTLSGTGGGTYTSTAGLSIDALTGTITPSASTAGSYVVTYTMAASGGCSLKTATTNVIIAIPGSWTGAISSNWSDAGNWLCGQIPTSVIDVIVPSGLSNYPVVVATGVSNKVSIGSGASLTVSGGTLQVYGAISSAGQINALNGTIEMKGPSGQGISGSMFYNKTIKNLLISNNGQLAISSAVGDTLKIGGTLSFGNSSGTLHTGDNLTLLSGATSTAAVGKLGTGNSISGKVVVERYINTGTGVGQHGKTWEFLSTPTMGQSIKESWMEGSAPSGDSHPGYGTQVTGPAGPAAGFDLASATASVKYYNSSTEGWTGAVNANDAVYNKKGYMVFVRGDRSVNGTTIKTATPTTLRTKGELFTGPQAPIAVAKDKYESIGNPYAAPIDFTQISREAGIDNKFYTWDPYLYGSYGLGGYQTLSSVTNWEPVPGGTKIYPSGIPKSTIRSGQAFLVHSTGIGPASYDLTITENSKVTSNASSETARPNGASPSTGRQFFSVSLYSGSDQSALIADGNTVAFSRSYNNAIDGDDALKLQNSGENFGLKRSGKILAIEARGPVSETDTLYYNMSNLKQQAYQLRFAPGNMESMGLSAYLSDRYLNTTTPINLSDTSVVNITVTSAAASSSADRFSVIFKQMAALPVTYTSVKAYEKGSDIVVAWTVENETGIQEYQIESSGDGNSFKKAAIVTAANRGSGSYEWLDRNVAAGNHYYRIKSVDKNGKSAYTQVVKVLTGQEARSITVYPNPVINQSIHLQLTNQPEGVYVVRLTDNRGQVILTRKINHAAGTSTEQLQCDHTLAKGIYNLEITTPTGEVKVIKVMISNL